MMNTLAAAAGMVHWPLGVVGLLLFLSVPAQAGLTFGEPSWEPSNTVRVDVDRARLLIPATYSCEPGEAATDDLQLTLEVESGRPGVAVLGSFGRVIPRTACLGVASQPWTQTLGLNVSATEEAPGDADIPILVRGTVASSGTAPASEAQAESTLRVGFRGILALHVEETKADTVNGFATFKVRVTNLSNAPVMIRFDLVEGDFDGWQPLVPPSLRLDSPGGEDMQKTIPFQVRAPGHKSEMTFQLKVTPSSLNDTAHQGQVYTVTLLARNGGLLNGNPAPAVGPLLAVALLACALAARRLAPASPPEGI